MNYQSDRHDEEARLSTLTRFDILDSPAEQEFDEIVSLTAQICVVPMAFITLVDDHRQWFKSRIGLDAEETPLDIAFCAHAIRGDEIMEVEDAGRDERFKDNPLVTGAPHIRFYAGAPLITADGFRLGTLAIADHQPRKLTSEQRLALTRLSREVIKQMELRLANRQLKDKSSFIQALVDSTAYSVISTDHEGTITSFNRAAEQLLGYRAAEVVGRLSVVALHDPAQLKQGEKTLASVPRAGPGREFDVLTALVSSGAPETREWTYIDKQGKAIPVLQTVSTIHNDDNKLMGYLFNAAGLNRGADAVLEPLARPASAGDKTINYGPGTSTFWNRIFIVMATYVVLAIIAGLLIKLIGYVSPTWPAPIWPSAGAALGFLMIWGWRYWPGVWLGSFVFNLGLLVIMAGNAGDTTLLVPVMMASAATLQALVAAGLCRRFFQSGEPLVRLKDTATFLALAGPVACLTAATIGSLSLIWLKAIPAENFAAAWVTWWTGDSIGSVLFAPLVLFFLPETRRFWHSRAWQVAPAMVLAAAIVSIVMLEFNQVEQTELRAQLKIPAEKAMIELYTRLEYYRTIAQAMQQFYLASDSVTAEEFANFTQSYVGKGIQGIAWVPRISRRDRLAMETSARREGLAGYRITELDPQGGLIAADERDEYFPVLYVNSMANNARVLGFDMASPGARRSLIDLARDTGQSVTSGRVAMMLDNSPGILVLTPNYGPDMDVAAASVEERRDALQGFTLVVVNLERLTGPLLRIARPHHLSIIMSDTISGDNVFVTGGTVTSEAAPNYEEVFGFFNRTWKVTVYSGQQFMAGQSAVSKWFLFICNLVTALFAMFVLTLSGRQVAISGEVESRTRELKNELMARQMIESNLREIQTDLLEKSNSLELALESARMIEWQMDSANEELVFNDRFFEMHATTAEREGGYRISFETYLREFVHPDDADYVKTEIGRVVDDQHMQTSGRVEHRNIRRDGKVINLLVYYRNSSGLEGLAGIRSGVIQDITEIKSLSSELRESERRFDVIFHSSPVASDLCELETGEYIDANDLFEQMISRKREDIIGETAVQLGIWGEFIGNREEFKRQLLEHGKIREYEALMVSEGGKQTTVSVSASRIDLDGRACVVTSYLDISQRKRAEEELRRINVDLEAEVKRRSAALVESEERMRLLLENLAEGVVACDADGQLTLFNREARLWHGMDALKVKADQWSEFFHLYDADGSRPLAAEDIPLSRAFNGEQVRNVGMSIVRKDMDTRFILASGGPMLDANGKKIGAVVVMHDISAARAAELQMRQALATLDATDDAIFIFTPDDMHLIYVNKGAVQQLGYSREELYTMRPADFDDGFWEATFVHYIEPMRRGDFKSARFTSSLRDKTGTLHPMEIILHYVSSADTGNRFIAVARDISERQAANAKLRQAAAELQEANRAIEEERNMLEKRVNARTAELKSINEQLKQAIEDAQEANRAKSSFLATMSHEIRTPMNGVIGMVDILSHSNVSEKQADAIRTIRQSADSLLRIIDDVLDFSKIEAGHLQLEYTRFSMCDMIESVCDSFLPAARKQDLDLFLYVDPLIPEHVRSDPTRLRQILINLISNAVKFSGGRPEMPGKVCVRAELRGRDPVKIGFVVKDNGIGIEADVLPTLFDPFTQAERSTTRRFGGAGLGLTICKRLAEIMQGNIDVSSTAGVGSTFSFTLPFEVPGEQPLPSMPNLSDVQCIVVDCVEPDMADIQKYVEHAGARTQRAGDYAAALKLAAATPQPVVIIRDLGGNRYTRDSEATTVRGVRSLLLTRGQRRKARVETQDIVSLDINAAHRDSLLRAVAVAAGVASPEIIEEQEILDFDVVIKPPTVEAARAAGRLILVAEDDLINQKVLINQLTLLGYAAELANNGVEALDMWREGNYAMLLTDIHMPLMDGYELAQKIRQQPQGEHVPIIAITANALRGEVENARAVGMDHYLTKPLKVAVLRDAIARYLPQDGKKLPAGAELADVAPAGSKLNNSSVVDINVLKGLVGTEQAIVNEFLTDFLASAADLRKGLFAAVGRNNSAQVHAEAHKFKSVSRVVGALALGDLCEALEQAGAEDDSDTIVALMAEFGDHLDRVETEIRAILEQETS